MDFCGSGVTKTRCVQHCGTTREYRLSEWKKPESGRLRPSENCQETIQQGWKVMPFSFPSRGDGVRTIVEKLQGFPDMQIAVTFRRYDSNSNTATSPRVRVHEITTCRPPSYRL